MLVVLFLIRVVLFYQLFLDLADFDIDGDGEPDDVNDLVAPVISYLCFGICAATTLRGIFDFSTVPTIVLTVALLPLYYATSLLRRIRPYMLFIYEIARSIVIMGWQRVIDGAVLMITAIGRAELARRGADVAKVDARATMQRQKSATRVAAAKQRRRKALAALARSAR